MHTEEQPEALRIADDLYNAGAFELCETDLPETAAAELRRLHARNAGLVEALKGVRSMSCCGQLDEFIGEPWLNDVHAALAKAEETK